MCALLEENPRLATYIRELAFDYNAQPAPSYESVLRLCTGLRRLACDLEQLSPLGGALPKLECLQITHYGWVRRRQGPSLLCRLAQWDRHLPEFVINQSLNTEGLEPNTSRFSADAIFIVDWNCEGGGEHRARIDILLQALARPPLSISLQMCYQDRKAWQNIAKALPVNLQSLELQISETSSRRGSWTPTYTVLEGFRFSDLNRLQRLRHLKLSYMDHKDAMGPLELPPALQSLKLDWYTSAWPFWEPLSQGLQSCQQLPALELEAVEDWMHTEEDDDDDTLQSLLRDFAAITAISMLYRLREGSIKPENLLDWWLQHQACAMPDALFQSLVESCRELIDELV